MRSMRWDLWHSQTIVPAKRWQISISVKGYVAGYVAYVYVCIYMYIYHDTFGDGKPWVFVGMYVRILKYVTLFCLFVCVVSYSGKRMIILCSSLYSIPTLVTACDGLSLVYQTRKVM
jgi:hypothetical protein